MNRAGVRPGAWRSRWAAVGAAVAVTLGTGKNTTNAVGDIVSTLATVTGGELSIETVTKDLTPPAETVEAGERFEVSFAVGIDSFGNGLCSVAVTYRQSTAAAPVVGPVIEQSGQIECEDVEACRIETP